MNIEEDNKIDIDKLDKELGIGDFEDDSECELLELDTGEVNPEDIDYIMVDLDYEEKPRFYHNVKSYGWCYHMFFVETISETDYLHSHNIDEIHIEYNKVMTD